MKRRCIIIFLLCLIISGISSVYAHYPPLVRLHTYADVTRIKKGEYLVTITLEIHNSDKKYPVVVEAISTEAWRGTSKIRTAESWLQSQKQIVVMQQSKQRVIQGSFNVNKQPPRSYWVRWLRFTAKTNRGHFTSNLVSTPYSLNVTTP